MPSHAITPPVGNLAIQSTWTEHQHDIMFTGSSHFSSIPIESILAVYICCQRELGYAIQSSGPLTQVARIRRKSHKREQEVQDKNVIKEHTKVV